MSEQNYSPNQYQQEASRTLISKPEVYPNDQEIMLVWTATGLAGEVGEVTELVKKSVFHRHDFDKDKLAKELGDVMWYVAAMCQVAGLQLKDVMTANIDKLKKRYPDGFNSQDSIKRTDVTA